MPGLTRQEAVAFGEWGLGSVALGAFVQGLSCQIRKNSRRNECVSINCLFVNIARIVNEIAIREA